MSRRRRQNFFDGFLDGTISIVKGLRSNSERASAPDAITSAERFLLAKLREGIHPDHVEYEIREELARVKFGSYEFHYLRNLLDMHQRLRNARAFQGLPTLAEMDAAERMVDRRRLLEARIRNRFLRETLQSMIDREVEHQIQLDRETIMRRAREGRNHEQSKASGSRYGNNPEVDDLRRAVSDLNFRVEGVEAQRDTGSSRGGRGSEARPPTQYMPAVDRAESQRGNRHDPDSVRSFAPRDRYDADDPIPRANGRVVFPILSAVSGIGPEAGHGERGAFADRYPPSSRTNDGREPSRFFPADQGRSGVGINPYAEPPRGNGGRNEWPSRSAVDGVGPDDSASQQAPRNYPRRDDRSRFDSRSRMDEDRREGPHHRQERRRTQIDLRTGREYPMGYAETIHSSASRR